MNPTAVSDGLGIGAWFSNHWGWIAMVFTGLVMLLCYRLVLRIFGIVIIPEDSIGIVNKEWVLFGKNKTLPDGAIIAMNGEAGLQADTLAPEIGRAHV